MPYSGQVIPQYTFHESVNNTLNSRGRTELTEQTQPNLPVGESIDDIAHFELIIRLINFAGICRVLNSQTVDHKSTLFFSQKSGSFRGVVNRKWGYECHNNCKKTFKNENPSPASVSADTIHFLGISRHISEKNFIAVSKENTYSDSVCKKPRECTRNTGGTKEESLSKLCSMAWIPECNVVCYTGIQSGFYLVSLQSLVLTRTRWRLEGGQTSTYLQCPKIIELRVVHRNL